MMTNDKETALLCIRQIPAASLPYEEWLQVGMALHASGATCEDWEQWSMSDSRFKPGDCSKRWRGFGKTSDKAVGVGTLVKMCRDNGGDVPTAHKFTGEDRELDWDSVIGDRDELQIVRPEYLTNDEVEDPRQWNPEQQLSDYLKAVYQDDEHVAYSADAWQTQADKDGKTKWVPNRGNYDRTAGKLRADLSRLKISEVIGDINPEAGAWIRPNPVDGAGVADSNVTSLRHALVECDGIPTGKQLAIYRELELPCSAIVHSGGKSIHAIVKIEASDMAEYRKRVDFLYEVCRKNGLQLDKANKNPSRLSRMPGVMRNGKKQWLIDTNCGKGSWSEWEQHIAEINDDLPDVEDLAGLLKNPPPLADAIIDGVLRNGHKLLLSGPSKAGKSFLLLGLSIAIAEGAQWIGWQVAKGRVLYVNLELDRASCIKRLADVYAVLGLETKNAGNIDLWNLRGKAMPMDKLAPKLIRRANKKKYTAIIIDPIYKVITGDENAADQMAKFCNLFDAVASQLGAAVIYCHHHSKGDQGHKRAADRSSGSGVFARDPDAVLDMIELEIDEKRRKAISDRWICDELGKLLDEKAKGWREECPQDSQIVAKHLENYARSKIGGDEADAVIDTVRERSESSSAWRVEGILREFANFKPRRMFYTYPIHTIDKWDLITDALAPGEEPPRKNRQEAIAEKKNDKNESTRTAVDACRDTDGIVRLSEIAEYLDVVPDVARRRLKDIGMKTKGGIVVRDEK